MSTPTGINETRVFGPPGTGKTTYTSKQITLAAQEYGSDNIIVASFTRAAAQELVGRGQVIPNDRIGTLHAHCYRLLGNPPLAEANVKDFNTQFPWFALTGAKETAIDDGLMADEAPVASANGDDLMATYNIYRAKMTNKLVWDQQVSEFAKCWEDFKAQCNYLDFQDLIDRAYDEYYPPHHATIGVFDEVQDFTPAQLRLLRKWAKQMHWIMLAGDDDQCLYSFTGATPEAFLNPPVTDEFKRILKQSYRVPRKIQALAQNIVTKLTVREPKDYFPRDEDGKIYTTDTNYRRPENLIPAIKTFIAEDKRVMILASCSYMLTPMLAALRNAGIPFSNTYKQNRGDWNPIRRTGGSFGKLCDFMHPAGHTIGGQTVWTPEQFSNWLGIIKAEGNIKRGGKTMLTKILKEKKVFSSQEILALMLEVLEDKAFDNATSLDKEWFMQNISGSKIKSLEFPSKIYDAYGPEGASLSSMVTVGTIHSVKGGEADVVILFPDLSIRGAASYLSGSGEFYDQVLRLFYVAVTRSRHTLILAKGLTKGQFFDDYN